MQPIMMKTVSSGIVLIGVVMGSAGYGLSGAQGAGRGAVIAWGDLIEELQQQAVDQLAKSVRSSDPFVRANAVEASLNMPNLGHAMRLHPMLQLALTDQAEVVRFAAAATVARGELKELISSVEPLLNDDSANVRAAAQVALYRCGRPVDLTSIAGMLSSKNPSWRANAALVMGLSGDRSAIPMLKDVGEVGLPIGVSQIYGILSRLQLAEARVKLGDESAISVMRANAFSSYGEVRVLAIMMLGQIGDGRMQESMFDVVESGPAPIELRLAAIGALGQIGSPAAIKDVLLMKPHLIEGAESRAAAVRAQSASTLGYVENARRRVRRNIAPTDPDEIRALFDDMFAMKLLVKLLGDDSEQVRVAAADALLRIKR